MKSQLPTGLRPSSARKREALLDAAEEEFLRKGYADARIDEVARRSGVAKQTAYSHFSSKEGLLAAVVRRANSAAADAVHREGPDPDAVEGVPAWLRRLARDQLDAVMVPRIVALRRLVIAELQRHPDLAAEFWAAGPDRSIAAFAQSFGRLHRAGLLHAPDPQRAAEHFNWLVMGQSLNAAVLLGDAALPDEGEKARIADAAAEAFLRGYSARLP